MTDKKRCYGSDKILVAVLSGEVVGYIHANDYDVLYMGHMKNIMGIVVRTDCKRNGVGRALFHEIEEWAKEDGAAGVRLVSGITRTGAHEFYRRCGYGEGREQKNFKKFI
ncbi:MAG: GNAT family N-acetyltransferase [Clostridiales bacterium]|nr:GNAT family N-acetyltransferase [Clostridiales bacterium]